MSEPEPVRADTRPTTSSDAPKAAAGRAAADLVADGMRVGFGTGSTARHFTLEVGRRIAEGDLRGIEAVPTSRATAELLLDLRIPTSDLLGPLDLVVDGADEIGPGHALIKGGGGALVREKIVAAATDRFVVIADESKLVAVLGAAFPLPVEVARFGVAVTTEALAAYGRVQLRGGDRPFVTDNGNYIVDLETGGIDDPDALDAHLNRVPGVFGTGLFVGMADVVLIAGPDGVRAERATR